MERASAVNSKKRTQEIMNSSSNSSPSGEKPSPKLLKGLRFKKPSRATTKRPHDTPAEVCCEECSKLYASASSLRQHMKNVHKMNSKCTNKSCNMLFRLDTERDEHSIACNTNRGEGVAALKSADPTSSSLDPSQKRLRDRAKYSDGILTVEILDVGSKKEGLVGEQRESPMPVAPQQPIQNYASEQPLPDRSKRLNRTVTGAHSWFKPQESTHGLSNRSYLMTGSQQSMGEAMGPSNSLRNQRHSTYENPNQTCLQLEAQRNINGFWTPNLSIPQYMEPAKEVAIRAELSSENRDSSESALLQQYSRDEQEQDDAETLLVPHVLSEPKTFTAVSAQAHSAAQTEQPNDRRPPEETSQDTTVPREAHVTQEAHTYLGKQLATTAKVSLQSASHPEFELLDDYEEMRLSSRDVVEHLSRILEDIASYDEYVRGKNKDSSEEIRKELRVLDRVTPLVELLEVLTESHLVFGTRSPLLLLLRCMFNVPSHSTLVEKLKLTGPELQALPLSVIVRGSLALLLKYEIFEGRDLEIEPTKTAQLKTLTEFHGARTAIKLVQYIGLLALKEDSFQRYAGARAYQLAASFYDILQPLTHWLPNSPNNTKQQHIKIIAQIVRESIQFAAQLKARTGKFSFYWPKSGEHFDPAVHEVDTAAQFEISMEELPNNNIDMRKQKIACTTMFAVWRTVQGRDRPEQYSKAKVVLMTPYVK